MKFLLVGRSTRYIRSTLPSFKTSRATSSIACSSVRSEQPMARAFFDKTITSPPSMVGNVSEWFFGGNTRTYESLKSGWFSKIRRSTSDSCCLPEYFILLLITPAWTTAAGSRMKYRLGLGRTIYSKPLRLSSFLQEYFFLSSLTFIPAISMLAASEVEYRNKISSTCCVRPEGLKTAEKTLLLMDGSTSTSISNSCNRST